MSDDGWTKSYRRKWRHPVFRNFRDAAVWAYLIDNAAWADNTDTRFDGERITLMRGDIAVSERFLAEGFSCDRQVIRRIFDALEKDHMIRRRKTHRSTIITICNYSEYQSRDEQENQHDNTDQTQSEPTENPNIEEDKELKSISPAPTRKANPEDAEFEAWYAAYPNKKDRASARRAYSRARKKASADLLLRAAQKFAVECSGKDRQYVKHPATWLNAEAWDNSSDLDIAPPPPAASIMSMRLETYRETGVWQEAWGDKPADIIPKTQRAA